MSLYLLKRPSTFELNLDDADELRDLRNMVYRSDREDLGKIKSSDPASDQSSAQMSILYVHSSC